MIFPGGWNDLELATPRPIKPIIAVAQIHDGSTYYDGDIVQSTDYYTPTGGVVGRQILSEFILNQK